MATISIECSVRYADAMCRAMLSIPTEERREFSLEQDSMNCWSYAYDTTECETDEDYWDRVEDFEMMIEQALQQYGIPEDEWWNI